MLTEDVSLYKITLIINNTLEIGE